jgi:hypothetical protein
VKYPGTVRGKLDACAGFAKFRRLLEDLNLTAALSQTQGCGETTDTTTGNEYPEIFHRVFPLHGCSTRKAAFYMPGPRIPEFQKFSANRTPPSGRLLKVMVPPWAIIT